MLPADFFLESFGCKDGVKLGGWFLMAVLWNLRPPVYLRTTDSAHGSHGSTAMSCHRGCGVSCGNWASGGKVKFSGYRQPSLHSHEFWENCSQQQWLVLLSHLVSRVPSRKVHVGIHLFAKQHVGQVASTHRCQHAPGILYKHPEKKHQACCCPTFAPSPYGIGYWR